MEGCQKGHKPIAAAISQTQCRKRSKVKNKVTIDDQQEVILALSIGTESGYSRGFPGKGHKTEVGYWKTSIFSSFRRCSFGTLGSDANIII